MARQVSPEDSPALETRQFHTVCEILRRNNHDPARLIPILQQVQKEYRYLPEEVLTFIATPLRLRPAQVFGVATFYAHFSLEPHGKYTIRLCDGTACHVRRSESILHALYERLGVNEKSKTTVDRLFTVETVSCLGACGLAPVMLVNEQVHGQVTPERALEIVDEIVAAEREEVQS
jgi:NADH-quinone oxidoreductase subunit E